MKTQIVSNQNWSNRAKTIVAKNLKQWHKTPYWLSVLRELGNSIVEIRADDGSVVFDEEKYRAIRAHCMSRAYAVEHMPYEETQV